MKNNFEEITKELGCELAMYFYIPSGCYGRYQIIIRTPKGSTFEYTCDIDLSYEVADQESKMYNEFETQLKEWIA